MKSETYRRLSRTEQFLLASGVGLVCTPIIIVMAPAPPSDRDLAGYWGTPTSTLDWCEENYVVSYYIENFVSGGKSPIGILNHYPD